MVFNTTRLSLRGTQPPSSTARRASQQPSDNDILGLVTSTAHPALSSSSPLESANGAVAPSSQSVTTVGDERNDTRAPQSDAQSASVQATVSPELTQILDAHPQLREAWNAAKQFRAVFATPAAAQDAKTQLDELDSMFFSEKPGLRLRLPHAFTICLQVRFRISRSRCSPRLEGRRTKFLRRTARCGCQFRGRSRSSGSFIGTYRAGECACAGSFSVVSGGRAISNAIARRSGS